MPAGACVVLQVGCVKSPRASATFTDAKTSASLDYTALNTALNLQVEWQNAGDPTKGFRYLYLAPEDYHSLVERGAAAGVPTVLKAERLVTEAGEERFQLTGGWVGGRCRPHAATPSSLAQPGCTQTNTTCLIAYAPSCPTRLADVVGLEDGLGVECLSGSGAIASAYSRAFREGFTVTLVSGRTVGIGAYLARLGRRWGVGGKGRGASPASCCLAVLWHRSLPGSPGLQVRMSGVAVCLERRWGQRQVLALAAAAAWMLGTQPLPPFCLVQVCAARGPAHHPDGLLCPEQAAGPRRVHLPHAGGRASRGEREGRACRGWAAWWGGAGEGPMACLQAGF